MDEPHRSLRSDHQRRLSGHARRRSYTKVLDRNEKARGIAAPTSVCSASGVLKSAKEGAAPFLYLCSSKSQP